MLTKFSKIMMYIASYEWLYVLLICRLLFNGKNKMMTNARENVVVIILLYALYLISMIWHHLFCKWDMNSRHKGKAENNITYEMLGFLLPYMVSIVTISIDVYGIIVNCAIFIILGIAFVSTDKIYFSPFLY